jgi:hypothetical protein
LKVTNLTHPLVSQLLVQFLDELQAALNFVERQLGSPNRPVDEYLVELIEISGTHLVQFVNQTIFRVGQFQICENVRDLFDLSCRDAWAIVHDLIHELGPAITPKR